MTVRVKPGSSRNEVVEEPDGVLVVRVHAQPVEGKANKAVCKLIAKHYGIAPGKVEVVRGHNARQKLVRLDLEA